MFSSLAFEVCFHLVLFFLLGVVACWLLHACDLVFFWKQRRQEAKFQAKAVAWTLANQRRRQTVRIMRAAVRELVLEYLGLTREEAVDQITDRYRVVREKQYWDRVDNGRLDPNLALEGRRLARLLDTLSLD